VTEDARTSQRRRWWRERQVDRERGVA
jgi:hypothetical protein